MSFWKKLFRKGEEPIAHYEHAILGKMNWSEDEESWIGKVGQLSFWIAYEQAATPRHETLEYAVSILTDTQWLKATLDEIKTRAIRDYGPDYEKEISSLNFVTFSFHGNERLSIHFFEGDDPPWWVADIHGRNVEGVSLDT